MKPCPVCSGELTEPHPVTVCASCHRAMLATGSIAVHTTAEFPAVRQVADAPETTAPRRPRTPTLPAHVSCSWCGKSGDEVRKILSGGSAHICDGCVALCAEIMALELT